MNNGNMETRVSILEEKARQLEQDRLLLHSKLDAIAAALAELKTLAALAKSNECPAPGTCLQLREEIRVLREEVDVLKELVAQQKGGWKLLVAIVGAATACGSLLTWLVNHFHKTP